MKRQAEEKYKYRTSDDIDSDSDSISNLDYRNRDDRELLCKIYYSASYVVRYKHYATGIQTLTGPLGCNQRRRMESLGECAVLRTTAGAIVKIQPGALRRKRSNPSWKPAFPARGGHS